jgi:outer membrane protein, multidrug efflux system
LSQARYRAGVDSFLVSLDAQRTAYAAEQDLVTTRAARSTNLVALYRTLGGGLAGSPSTQDRIAESEGKRPEARP